MRVLLVSALRDEGPHLLEWVAHHRAIGVTDFLLFSNDCSDGTDAMLDALAPFGVVPLRNAPPKGKSLQWNALKQAWGHNLRRAADWVLGIDCDEFVNLRPPLTGLADLVGVVGEADAVVLPWRLFGHNGERRLTEGRTTELFTRAAPSGCDYPVGARQFKTLFRAKGPFNRIGVHRPRLKTGAAARWVDGSGQAMPADFAAAEQRITLFGRPEASGLVQLNHYSVRSAESFMVKRARGLPNRKAKQIDLTYWVERNFNTVEDVSVAQHSAATEAVLAEIMDLPGMAELQAAAHARHHAVFAEMMQDEAMVKLYGRLLLAASSAPLPDADIRRLVAMYRTTQG
ncbi:MAG: glycosyltransferase family 2 protein [Rhodobacter sp.]|nr:glycosyltransferase family 2 protein [Rhodobacter sp.]